MTKQLEQQRRTFIKATMVAAAMALIPFATTALGQSSTGISPEDLPPVQVLPSVITIRGSLFAKSIRLTLQPGVISGPIELSGNGTYRVRVTPQYIRKTGEQIYRVSLIDATSGNTLDEMSAIGNMCATFEKQGVQIYIGPSPSIVEQQWHQATGGKQG